MLLKISYFFILLSVCLCADDVLLQISSKFHTQPVRKILKINNDRFITISRDKTIKIWDIDDFNLSKNIYGETGAGLMGGYNTAAYNNMLLAVSGEFSDDQRNHEMLKTRIFDITTGKLIKLLDTTDGLVRALHFIDEGNKLIVAYAHPYYTFSIWDTKSWKQVNKIQINSRLSDYKNRKYYRISRVISSRYDNDDVLLLVTDHGDIDIFSMNKNKIIKTKNIGSPISDIVTNGKYIFIISENKIIKYDYDLNKIEENIRSGNFNHLRISPDKKSLIACDLLECSLYDSDKIIYQKSLLKLDNTIQDIIFVDNDRILVTGGHQSKILMIDVNSSSILNSMQKSHNGIYSIGINDNLLAISNEYNETNNSLSENLNYFINLNSLKKEKKRDDLSFITSLPKEDHYASIKQDNQNQLTVSRHDSIPITINRGDRNGFTHNVFGLISNGTLISGGGYGFIEGYNLKNGNKIVDFIGHNDHVVGLVQYKNYLITSGYEGVVNIWSLDAVNQYKDEKVVTKLKVKFLSERFGISEDEVVKNGFEIYSKYGVDIYEDKVITEKPLVSFFVDALGEFVTWTQEGYFTVSSPKALKYISWHMNRGYDKEAYRYDLSKFYDVFFRPDLVKLKLQGKDITPYTGGLTAQDALKNPPPSLKIIAVDDTNQHLIDSDKPMQVATKQEKVKVKFSIADEGGGVGSIRIYQEGKLIQIIGSNEITKVTANIDSKLAEKSFEESKKSSSLSALAKAVNKEELTFEDRVGRVDAQQLRNQAGTYEAEVSLKEGSNQISIEAFNSTNTITSYQASIDIKAEIPKKPSKLYAIVAGVNNFDASYIPTLKYAVGDAKAIADEMFKAKKTIYDDVEVIYLTDKEVTKESIYDAFENVQKKASVNDTVVFYISTHGTSANGTFYLFPSNNADAGQFIDFSDLFKMSSSMKALSQVFIVDACQSGGAVDIASSVYDSRASVMARSAGIHLLSASTSGTSAFENEKVGHGVFTNEILASLKNPLNDTNKDGFVSIIEVSNNLIKRQQEEQNNAQMPVIRNVGNDIFVKKINEKKLQ